MKKLQIVVLTFCIAFVYTTTISAGEGSKAKTRLNIESVENNLLQGLNSDNCGLKMSCAYFLGEMKSDKAVIPLMKMLRDEKNECHRLMAALALIKIGDPRGIYMVKRRSEFDSSLRVRNMCERFYKAFKLNEIQIEKTESAERLAIAN